MLGIVSKFFLALYLTAQATSPSAEDCGELYTALCAPPGNVFHQPDNSYGEIFVPLIEKTAKSPGRFEDDLTRFVDARKEVSHRLNREAEIDMNFDDFYRDFSLPGYERERNDHLLRLLVGVDTNFPAAVHLMDAGLVTAVPEHKLILAPLNEMWKRSESRPLHERIEEIQPLLKTTLKKLESAGISLSKLSPLRSLITGGNNPPLPKMNSLAHLQEILINRARTKHDTARELLDASERLVTSTVIEPTGRYSELFEKLSKSYQEAETRHRLAGKDGKVKSWDVSIYLRRVGGKLTRVPENQAQPTDAIVPLQSVQVRRAPNGDIESFKVVHGHSEAALRISRLPLREYIGQLYEEIPRTEQKAAAKRIAEFEALFMMVNYPNRGGASIGDAMSLSLQKNRGIRLRQSFQSIDFEVIPSLSVDEYINTRAQAILGI